jgi:hypothetical protein
MKNRAVSPLHAGFLIVFVIVAAGLWFFRSAPQPPASPLRTKKLANENFLRQKALESGGDINRLSANDQEQVNNLTGGQGANTLRSMAPRAAFQTAPTTGP